MSMNYSDSNLDYMSMALNLAEKRRGFCAPNPAVGAVVVKNGKVIGEGTHWACGQAHAEVAALQSLGEQARGATLYVTLEPCSHYGRTPPCTELIIRNGIQQVFYGQYDPNPNVTGKGASVLRQAGISCQRLSDSRVEQFYNSYRHWLTTKQPYVTAKLAISLDGKIAGLQGKPIAITGVECQEFTHQRRLHSDALLTTIATIISDDPQLNARTQNEIYAKPLYILDSQLRMPLNAKVFQTAKSVTIFHGASADNKALTALSQAGAKCLAVSTTDQGLNLKEILAIIGADGIHDLWVEAGGRCFDSLVRQHLAQQLFIYVSAKILGLSATSGFIQSLDLLIESPTVKWQAYGADVIAQIVYQ